MNRLERLLIVGYGNTLRGDDAVGPLLAERAADWKQAWIEAVSFTQLTPELSAILASVDVAVFLDASRTPLATPRWRRLQPATIDGELGVDSHAGRPSVLLSAAKRLFGCSPTAWQIDLPARRFDLGASLSSEAQVGLELAELQLRRWSIWRISRAGGFRRSKRAST